MVYGTIGLDNQDLGMAEIAVPFLQTVQYFLSLTMQRNENEKMLFELSQIDRLTSFYNRNRFIQDLSLIHISVPCTGAGDLHLQILAALSRKLIYDEFRDQIAAAASAEEILALIGDQIGVQ